MTSRIHVVTATAAALILGVSACISSEDPTTSTSTAPVQTAPTTTCPARPPTTPAACAPS